MLVESVQEEVLNFKLVSLQRHELYWISRVFQHVCMVSVLVEVSLYWWTSIVSTRKTFAVLERINRITNRLHFHFNLYIHT